MKLLILLATAVAIARAQDDEEHESSGLVYVRNFTCPVFNLAVEKVGNAGGDIQAGHTPLDADEIEYTVEQTLTWANPLTTPLSCIDGRHPWPIFGTPGGDLAELIAAFQVYINRNYPEETDETVLSDEIYDIMRELIAALPPGRQLYMHTDYHKLDAILETLDVTEEEFQQLPEADQGSFDDPAPCEPEMGFACVIDTSDGIGCGHLKLMLIDASEADDAPVGLGDYLVYQVTVETVIKTFYDALWNGGDPTKVLFQVDLVSVAGDHFEGAIVSISGDSACLADTHPCHDMEPMINPLNDDISAFVVSPGALDSWRQWLGAFFSRQEVLRETTPVVGASDPLYLWYEAEITEIVDAQTGFTVAALAPGLPIYSVTPKLSTLNGDDEVNLNNFGKSLTTDCLEDCPPPDVLAGSLPAGSLSACYSCDAGEGCTNRASRQGGRGRLVVTLPDCDPATILQAENAVLAVNPLATFTVHGCDESKKGLLGLLGLLGIIPLVCCSLLLALLLLRRKKKGPAQPVATFGLPPAPYPSHTVTCAPVFDHCAPSYGGFGVQPCPVAPSAVFPGHLQA